MKTNNLFFLLFVVLFGCQKETNSAGEDSEIQTYTVVFTALLCDKALDVNCVDAAAKTIAPNVKIYLFESEYEREEGEPILRNGVTDAGGKVTFSGLEAKDYFYIALYPYPDDVQNDPINHFVRISPNTYKVSEEVLFVGK